MELAPTGRAREVRTDWVLVVQDEAVAKEMPSINRTPMTEPLPAGSRREAGRERLPTMQSLKAVRANEG